MKNELLTVRLRRVMKSFLLSPFTFFLFLKSFLATMSIVSSKGMLVNNESMSNEDMKNEEFCFLISSANVKESLLKNSLDVNSDRIGTKNLASLYDGVLIAERMGRKGGQSPTDPLWTLQSPYKTPGWLPKTYRLM